MKYTEEDLIRQEQQKLDSVISQMDKALQDLGKIYKQGKRKAEDAVKKSLPDTYGALIHAHYDSSWSGKLIQSLKKGKNELYSHRLVLDSFSEEDESEQIDMPVGLHTYSYLDKVYIFSWVRPVCRHFILNNVATEYDGDVEGENGVKHFTHFDLKMKREVEIFFDHVKKVQQFFPLTTEESETLVYDAFLQELLSRRSEQEFRNIVFSIQKKQGEIIQAPFSQNMIVQGCAGSGKSMIMLHRLPIILFDNSKTLSRSHLYIITPSSTYIEMSSGMRSELEIEDLQMGTLNQYYDHVIRKYGNNPAQYGTIYPHIELGKDLTQYLYSDTFPIDIQQMIGELLNRNYMDLEPAHILLDLPEKKSFGLSPMKHIQSEVSDIQAILSENTSRYRRYSDAIQNTVLELDRLNRLLRNRRDTVIHQIRSKISVEQERIADCRAQLAELEKEGSGSNKKDALYKSRLRMIRNAKDKLIFYNEELRDAVNNTDYFTGLIEIADWIDSLVSLYSHYITNTRQITITEDQQYKEIENLHVMIRLCHVLLSQLESVENPYIAYTDPPEKNIGKFRTAVTNMEMITVPVLEPGMCNSLRTRRTYLQEKGKNIALDLYSMIMEKLGQIKNRKGKYDALTHSPYIYLQILYQLEGAPNQAAENMISIDEAQNIAVEELRLIKAVNKGQAVFNLYGDIRQHVENSKGIDDWNSLMDVVPFQIYTMEENYRNAKQVTEHCNKLFHMNMLAINLDGSGVHRLPGGKELFSRLRSLLKRTMKSGMSCMIVKSAEEASLIFKNLGDLKFRLHDLTSVPSALYPNHWNVMTVSQAKGLEFETVIAFSGRMTENEKYIAYTRALDELYICNEVVHDNPAARMIFNDKAAKVIKESETVWSDTPASAGGLSQVTESANTGSSEKPRGRTLRKKRASKESSTAPVTGTDTDKSPATIESGLMPLSEFFKQRGLQIIDDRNKSGYLWVLGTEETIGNIITEASSLYGIFGNYSPGGKTTSFKPGWFTKTKK